MRDKSKIYEETFIYVLPAPSPIVRSLRMRYSASWTGTARTQMTCSVSLETCWAQPQRSCGTVDGPLGCGCGACWVQVGRSWGAAGTQLERICAHWQISAPLAIEKMFESLANVCAIEKSSKNFSHWKLINKIIDASGYFLQKCKWTDIVHCPLLIIAGCAVGKVSGIFNH